MKYPTKKYFLFLDESGDDNLRNIDPNYPVLVLGGPIVEEAYYNNVLCPTFKTFKYTFFNKQDVVLHTRDIDRNTGDFKVFRENGYKKGLFFNKVNTLLTNADFTALTAVITKNKIKKYSHPYNPYSFALDFLIERFYYFLKEKNAIGQIIAESRNSTGQSPSDGPDGYIRSRFQLVMVNGTDYIEGEKLRKYINNNIIISKKAPDRIGLQVADLIVTPVGRHVIGRNRTRYAVRYNVVQQKFRRRNGKYAGVGLKIF